MDTNNVENEHMVKMEWKDLSVGQSNTGAQAMNDIDWDNIDWDSFGTGIEDTNTFGSAAYNTSRYVHLMDGNFFNNVFFFFNIISYLIFCTYLSMLSYSDIEFLDVRDKCVEGAWYEMNMATQLGM